MFSLAGQIYGRVLFFEIEMIANYRCRIVDVEAADVAGRLVLTGGRCLRWCLRYASLRLGRRRIFGFEPDRGDDAVGLL
jgi:hypothetical protein